MRYRNVICTVLVFAFSDAASAHENEHSHHAGHQHAGHSHKEHRQHGAHTHGVAEVTLAAIGGEVMATLQVPAGDILGFERAPSDAQEEQYLRQQLTWLESAQWLSLANAAKCQLTDSHAHTGLLDEDHSGHADIHVELVWQCQKPLQIGDIEILLFSSYEAISEVQVDWLLESQSGRTTLIPGS